MNPMELYENMKTKNFLLFNTKEIENIFNSY